MPSQLFDDIEPTGDPWRYSESDYELLRRADGPIWDRVRATLDEWYGKYQDPEGDLRSRFREADARQHSAAWWELYVYTLFRSLGWTVEVHPSIPGSSRRPDFLATNERSTVYIECVTAFDGPHTAKADAEAWLKDCINEAVSPDFGFSMTINHAGSARVQKSVVTQQIERWISTIDYESERVSSLDPGAARRSKTFKFADSQVTLTAMAVPEHQRGDHGPNVMIGPMVSLFGESSVVRLRKLLSKKASQGKGIQESFIVAVLSRMTFARPDQVDQALFGADVVQYTLSSDGDSAHFAARVRKPDGLWHPGPPARGTRLSGVLFAEQLGPAYVANYLPTLWINPWSANPLVGALPFQRRSASSAGEVSHDSDATGDARTILGLPPQWPGPI